MNSSLVTTFFPGGNSVWMSFVRGRHSNHTLIPLQMTAQTPLSAPNSSPPLLLVRGLFLVARYINSKVLTHT